MTSGATPLRVGLNGNALLSPLTGIGQYTRRLAEAMLETGDVDLKIFYAARWSRDVRSAPLRHAAKLKDLIKRYVPHPYKVSRLLQQIRFSQGTAGLQIYHEPNFLPYRFRGPTVITVHDLSFVRFPETHPADRVALMNRLLPPALERASHILVDSDFVRGEVMSYYGVDANRITTTLLAARPVFHPRTAAESAETLHRNGLEGRPYFLCVGTLEPRKNVITVLRAHAALPPELQRRCPLVLVGMRGWLSSPLEVELQPMVEKGNVIPLGFVNDEDLAVLYSNALAFAYPSIYEGFGLPPLEAMASGTPTIVSNVSSLPEVAGDGAIQLDPNDVIGLRDALQAFAEDAAFRAEKSAAGLRQAAQFSWERCAAETISVYRKVTSQ